MKINNGCQTVIEAKRVFDGCAFGADNVSVAITTDTDIPLMSEFVGARVVSAEFNVQSIERGEHCSRVVGEAVTRFAISYTSGGATYTVGGTFRETRDVLLKLPSSNAAVPFDIEAQTSFMIASGAIVGGRAVTVTGCVLQIIKVTATVDIVVPTLGYCKYPPCKGCMCPGLNGKIFPEPAE